MVSVYFSAKIIDNGKANYEMQRKEGMQGIDIFMRKSTSKIVLFLFYVFLEYH